MNGADRFRGPRKLLIEWDILGVFRFAKTVRSGAVVPATGIFAVRALRAAMMLKDHRLSL
jgi:hypothetical protein